MADGRLRYWDGTSWTSDFVGEPSRAAALDQTKPVGGWVPITAFCLGLASIVLWIIPILGAMVALSALVLSILALALNTSRKGISVAAVSVAPVTLLLGSAMTIGFGIFSVSDSGRLVADSTSSPSAPPNLATPGLDDDNSQPTPVRINLAGVECGLSTGEFDVSDDSGQETCVVKLTVENSGMSRVDLTYLDFTAANSGVTFEASSRSVVGSTRFNSSVEPGESLECELVYVVPTKTVITELVVDIGFLDDPVFVSLLQE